MNNRIDANNMSASVVGRVQRADQGGQASGQDNVTGISQSRLSLTESAHRLQEAINVGGNEAVFNAKRVAEVKEAIANGSYRMDAGVIADQLIHFDRTIDF